MTGDITERTHSGKAHSAAVVGLVGLGSMGAPMARCLSSAVDKLLLYDLDAERSRELAEETGARAALSLSELGHSCTLLILMLPDSDIVNTVVMGDGESDLSAQRDSLIKSMAAGTIIVDMGSSNPLSTQRLGRQLLADRIILLDAPVSGGVVKARSGQLSIMLGGDDVDAMDTVNPVLEAMGSVFRTGKLGSGHASKALNNYVSACGLVAACEAVIAGRRFGLDPQGLIDVINASTGRNNSTENKLGQFVLNAQFRQAGFALELMAKDLRTAADLASGLGLHLGGIYEAEKLWASARDSLPAQADHTEIYRYIEQLSN